MPEQLVEEHVGVAQLELVINQALARHGEAMIGGVAASLGRVTQTVTGAVAAEVQRFDIMMESLFLSQEVERRRRLASQAERLQGPARLYFSRKLQQLDETLVDKMAEVMGGDRSAARAALAAELEPLPALTDQRPPVKKTAKKTSKK